MALKLSAIGASTVLRRRLPLVVGAFCVLSLGLSKYYPSLSVSSEPDFPQSLLYHNNLRSKSSEQKQSQSGIHNSVIRMEAEKKTVPSIVVYVTVPNKEAGKKLAVSIINERLAACVNRVPGMCFRLLDNVRLLYCCIILLSPVHFQLSARHVLWKPPLIEDYVRYKPKFIWRSPHRCFNAPKLPF